jgi:hypothetical protein
MKKECDRLILSSRQGEEKVRQIMEYSLPFGNASQTWGYRLRMLSNE